MENHPQLLPFIILVHMSSFSFLAGATADRFSDSYAQVKLVVNLAGRLPLLCTMSAVCSSAASHQRRLANTEYCFVTEAEVCERFVRS